MYPIIIQATSFTLLYLDYENYLTHLGDQLLYGGPLHSYDGNFFKKSTTATLFSFYKMGSIFF